MITKLKEEIKEAMIKKDSKKKDVLKMILSKATEIAKEAKTEVITDSMVFDAAKKELKQLQQTIDSLKGKENTDLYKESVLKSDILKNGYIPEQMSEEELKTSLALFIEENNLKSEGKAAIRKIMPEYKDKADGKLVNKIALELLS